MKNPVTIFWAALGIIIIAAIAAVLFWKPSTTIPDGKYDTLAQCVKDSGAVFYGAFWCPHCQRTKALFGTSARYLPYVECSTPDQQGQTQVCKDKGIQGYPTWYWTPTSTPVTGELTLEQIASSTRCVLPQ